MKLIGGQSDSLLTLLLKHVVEMLLSVLQTYAIILVVSLLLKCCQHTTVKCNEIKLS
jgi:hypothetical protein